jgi:hypothetical protein
MQVNKSYSPWVFTRVTKGKGSLKAVLEAGKERLTFCVPISKHE